MGSGAVWILAAMMAATPPVNGGAVTFTQVTINDSVGDHFDPHVDGELAAYSSVSEVGFDFFEQIHYFDFATSTDQVINNVLADGGLGRDLLSDVDSNRVVFTRIFGDHNGIMLFDRGVNSLTELAAASNSQRLGVALGGNTVAFIDYGFWSDGTGELMVLDLPGASPLRLTTDSANDFSPAVSPDGASVTWVHCEGTAACDIWVARRSGASWSAGPLVATTDFDTEPDTSGTQVVFQRDDFVSATGTDLVLVPVTGGPAVRIELPGSQRHPSIRGDIVAFENRVDLLQPSDIYVLQLSTNRYFQLTNTPTINETLNDVTVLSDGSVRVVWQASDPSDGVNNNIFGATFTIPAPPTCSATTVTLEANRSYANSGPRWTDGTATLGYAVTIPATIPVIQGNSGNKSASLTFTTSSGRVECRYRGGSNRAHPTSAADLAAASRYVFDRCSNRQSANTPIIASSVALHVQKGDSRQPNTRVRVTLTRFCGPVPPPPGDDDDDDHDDDHDGGDDDDDDDDEDHDGDDDDDDDHDGDDDDDEDGHGDDDDDDDDLATSQSGLGNREPGTPNAGCSSSGSLAPMALFALGLLVLMRRSAAIRVVATRERRKLLR
jgi:hypothetical protein